MHVQWYSVQPSVSDDLQTREQARSVGPFKPPVYVQSATAHPNSVIPVAASQGCNAHLKPAAYLFEIPVQHSLHVIVAEGRETSLGDIYWNAIG